MIYDLIIIGAGPAGYTAAIQASKRGLKTALVEKGKLGGTCLNRGCIPTKTYYRNAEFMKDLREAEEFAVSLEGYSFSLEKTWQRKEEVVARLVAGIEQLIKAHKIDFFAGQASFVNANTIVVKNSDGEQEELTGKNIIIATGSKTNLPPIKGIDHPQVLDSSSILDLKELPQDLIIIGGGVIGLEFAGIFNYFGCQVEILEYLPEILLHEDREVIKRFMPLLKRQGIKVSTSVKVTDVIKMDKGFLVKGLDKKDKEVEFEASALLNAAGRQANFEGLNLDKAGLKLEKNHIKVNDFYQTNVKNIYAIGDVNGKIQLAHAASHQAIMLVDYIYDQSLTPKDLLIPSCTFTFPEIASIGLTEEAARDTGLEIKTNKFLFLANGKALAKGEKDGFVKVITDDKNKIIGVHILGPHASDLIHEAAAIMAAGQGVEDVKNIVHAHPTLSEAFDEAVLGISGAAIHQI